MSDLSSKAHKGAGSKPKPAQIGLVIREFRNALGLTQVQFASEIGITPTSVYRYEAGSNIPTNDILAKILQFAVKKQSLNAVQSLAEALATRSALFLFDGGAEAPESGSPLDLAITRLRLEEQLDIMAAVLMLQESSDRTAARIFKNLVQPWVSKAQEVFGPVHFTQGSFAKKTTIGRAKKETP